LAQCFVWMMFRMLFFLLVDAISNIVWLHLTLYWLPINIQYSTFSLLIVYYAHLHHSEKSQWKDFKKNYMGIWAGLNLLLLVLGLVWVSLDISYTDSVDDDEPSWLGKIHGIYSGIIFFGLVIMLAWSGWGAALLMRNKPAHGQTKLIAKLSFPRIVIVTFSLFVLFTTRMLYDFVSSAGKMVVDISSGTDQAAIFTLIAFCLWEIIPTILVLVLFGAVRATTLGAFTKSEPRLKNPNYTKVNSSFGSYDSGTLPSQLFGGREEVEERIPFNPTGSATLYGSLPAILYANNNININSSPDVPHINS